MLSAINPFGRLICLVLFLLTLPAGATELRYGFELGLRNDQLRWSVAGSAAGTDPNILSELDWENVSSLEIGVFGRLYFDNDWYLEAGGSYGEIITGDAYSTDYFSNDREDAVSQLSADADDGRVSRGKFALGRQYGRRNSHEGMSLLFIPMIGYARNEQDLTLSDGMLLIPENAETPAGLNSEYNTTWRGPFVGFRVQYDKSRTLGFFMTYEYHDAIYLAEGIWNLRSDLAQDPSFRHYANAEGHVFGIGVRLTPMKDWTLLVTGNYQTWTSDPGRAVTYFSFLDLSTSTQLNSVDWDSWSLTVSSPLYRF